MGDTDGAGRGVGREFAHQIRQLPLRTAADQRAALDRADTRRIIAAIFHAAQPVDEAIRHLILADNSDDSTHGWRTFLSNRIRNADARRSEEHTSELQSLMRIMYA